MELACEVEEGKVIITLPERVNESNADGIKNQLLSILGLHDNLVPEVDCKDLRYISSSGLRALLTFQKKRGGERITLKNVCKEVNGILEMTGFADIFHVSQSVKKLDISGYEKLANGINGSFYRMQKGMMVKVFRKDVTLEEAEQEIEMAKKALVAGVPTPISFTIVKCEESYGIIFEEIEPVSIAQMIKQYPLKLEMYALKYADFVKELHQTEVVPGILPSIKTRYLEWLEQAEQMMAPSKCIGMKEMVNRLEDRQTFVHGDLSPDHVFLVGNDVMVMDMASCGYGHPVFDLQAIYASMVAIEIAHPGYCEEKFGINASRCRQIWKIFINRYMDDGDEAKMRRLNQLLERYYILKEQILDSMEKGKDFR